MDDALAAAIADTQEQVTRANKHYMCLSGLLALWVVIVVMWCCVVRFGMGVEVSSILDAQQAYHSSGRCILWC